MAEQVGREAELRPDDKPEGERATGSKRLVTDKGYHSGAVVKRVKSVRGAQLHSGEEAEGAAQLGRAKRRSSRRCTQNRRRVRGEYGKSLLRRRGELVERSFAHCYETGGMRRCHLRGQENILKRQLIHVGAFNLSLILRKLLGAGTPREWKNRFGRLILTVYLLFTCRIDQKRFCRSRISRVRCQVLREIA